MSRAAGVRGWWCARAAVRARVRVWAGGRRGMAVVAARGAVVARARTAAAASRARRAVAAARRRLDAHAPRTGRPGAWGGSDAGGSCAAAARRAGGASGRRGAGAAARGRRGAAGVACFAKFGPFGSFPWFDGASDSEDEGREVDAAAAGPGKGQQARGGAGAGGGAFSGDGDGGQEPPDELAFSSAGEQGAEGAEGGEEGLAGEGLFLEGEEDGELSELRLDLSRLGSVDWRTLDRVHVLVSASADGAGGAHDRGAHGVALDRGLYVNRSALPGQPQGPADGGMGEDGEEPVELFAFQVEESLENGEREVRTALLAFESREDGEGFAAALNQATDLHSEPVFVGPAGELSRAGLLEVEPEDLDDMEQQMGMKILCVPAGTDLLEGLGPGGLADALGGPDAGMVPDFSPADFDFQDPSKWRTAETEPTVAWEDAPEMMPPPSELRDESAETGDARLSLERAWSLSWPEHGGMDGLGEGDPPADAK